jgi:FtsP/CotA-like multicopper oxidase with cupredoxin domain
MPAAPVSLVVGDDRDGGVRLSPGASAGSAAAEDGTRWPELDLTGYGAPAPTPFDLNSHFDRHFTLVLDRNLTFDGVTPRYAYTVNGEADPQIPTQVVRENDLVRFTIVNRGQDLHPWHLHGHAVLILAKDGHAVTGSPLWRDTFDV